MRLSRAKSAGNKYQKVNKSALKQNLESLRLITTNEPDSVEVDKFKVTEYIKQKTGPFKESGASSVEKMSPKRASKNLAFKKPAKVNDPTQVELANYL